jgi:hypothetical protein
VLESIRLIDRKAGKYFADIVERSIDDAGAASGTPPLSKGPIYFLSFRRGWLVSLRTLGRCGRCFFLLTFDGLPVPFLPLVSVRDFFLAPVASEASERPKIFRKVTFLVLLRSDSCPNVTSMPALRRVADTTRIRLLNRVASLGQSFCFDTRYSVWSRFCSSIIRAVVVPLHSVRFTMNAVIAVATGSSSISASFRSVALAAKAAANEPDVT